MGNKNNLEGKSLVFISFESHLVDVLFKWFDIGASIHVKNLYTVSKRDGGHAGKRLTL